VKGSASPGASVGQGRARSDDRPLVYKWPEPLVPASLVRRYERFVADVRLEDGRELRVHCVNPGRMEGLVVPGARVWLSQARGEGRVLGHTWELIELNGRLVGANTALPNVLVRSLLEQRLVAGFDDVTAVRAEQRFGQGQRVDFLLERAAAAEHLEVKNCHLVYPDGFGYFPDSRSERATHHVESLAALVRAGGRATVLFTVQRGDAQGLRPSALHDPAFAEALARAAAAGVRVRAVRFEPTLEGLRLDGEIPVDLGPWSLETARAHGRQLEATSGWVRKDGAIAGARLPEVARVGRVRPPKRASA
jgi:sugar fermentation stimulation protein A